MNLQVFLNMIHSSGDDASS